MTCPDCSAPGADIFGFEVRGVYDGVLYWQCSKCGHAWNRWDERAGRRFYAAESYVTAANRHALLTRGDK